jgi:hypothetical protein
MEPRKNWYQRLPNLPSRRPPGEADVTVVVVVAVVVSVAPVVVLLLGSIGRSVSAVFKLIPVVRLAFSCIFPMFTTSTQKYSKYISVPCVCR